MPTGKVGEFDNTLKTFLGIFESGQLSSRRVVMAVALQEHDKDETQQWDLLEIRSENSPSTPCAGLV